MPDRGSCILCDSSLWLLLAIAASWVGVAQLARAAEQLNGHLQETSIVHLMTWANATAWIFLAVPHMMRKSQEAKSDDDEKVDISARIVQLVTADVFQCRHAFQFLAIALATNYAYIAALHFLAASLNTAIFCSSPVFTLLFSLVFLSSEEEQSKSFCERFCSWQTLSVVLSVLGVIFIAEPWHASAHSSMYSRMAGVGLSIFAALGTATYQVYFKLTFEDRMKPDEVGLFLAYMGFLIFALCGAILAIVLYSGTYPLQLSKVPWGLVVSTSISSAVFNFLIKFGLSRDTPVAVSLATQIGIPLNLMVDVLIVHARIDHFQSLGTILMLVAFSLQKGPACCSDDEDARTVSAGAAAVALVEQQQQEGK